MSDVTIQSLKALAKTLRSDTVSHSQALELAARQHGFKDWNAAAARVPDEPKLSNFERAVHGMNALKTRTIELYLIPQYHQSREFGEWLADFDRIVRWMTRNLEVKPTAAILRYAIGHLKLPAHFGKMPNLAEFSNENRDLIMADGKMGLSALFEEYFPDVSFSGNDARPMTYSVLVRRVSEAREQKPDITEEEVVLYMRETAKGQPFNENTVRGLVRRNAASVASEARLLMKEFSENS